MADSSGSYTFDSRSDYGKRNCRIIFRSIGPDIYKIIGIDSEIGQKSKSKSQNCNVKVKSFEF
jgi:hypothetical protein